MADFNKIGLLVLNEDGTKFLVCQKHKDNDTTQYIMPGGKVEEGEFDLKCLVREIDEELCCKVDMTSLDYLEEYIDLAAGHLDKYVSIKLYKGKLIGDPIPSGEIAALHWIGKDDLQNDQVSKIIKTKILPDILEKGILKEPLINNYNPDTIDHQGELFWHVDENDNVIGSIPRKIAHNQSNFPWHRSTHIYLFDNEGNLYLSQRSFKKDTGAGMWTVSAGGHVKYGETYEDTANKEIVEELGISAELELIDKLSIDFGTEKEVIAIFAGITDNIKFTVHPDEVEQIKGFEYKDIVVKFRKGEFTLSGGSNDTFRHIINNGKLESFYKERFMQ